MANVNPAVAVGFARDVYTVTSTKRYLRFVEATPEFSQASRDSSRLSAEVGSRLINIQDNFAICARGADQWKNDIFLIFRGSTAQTADWVVNFRAGVGVSACGTMVHTGFNHVFGSMIGQLGSFIQQQTGVNTLHSTITASALRLQGFKHEKM